MHWVVIVVIGNIGEAFTGLNNLLGRHVWVPGQCYVKQRIALIRLAFIGTPYQDARLRGNHLLLVVT